MVGQDSIHQLAATILAVSGLGVGRGWRCVLDACLRHVDGTIKWQLHGDEQLMGTLKTLAITLLMTVAAVACGGQADTVRSEGVQPSSASSAGGLSPTTFGNANPNCGPPNESGPATTYGPVSPSSSASPGSSSVDTAQPSPIAPGFGVGQANALKPEYPGNPAAAIRARLPGIQRLSAIANATIDANGNLTITVGAKGLNEGPDAMRDEWAATVLYGDLLDDVGTNSGSPTRGSWLRSARVVSVADCTEYLLTGTGLGTSVPNGQVFRQESHLSSDGLGRVEIVRAQRRGCTD
jgi:hypothetical protein